ncbi:MAG: hypothetical protein ACRCXT_18150 [Paraclostridium sp.]
MKRENISKSTEKNKATKPVITVISSDVKNAGVSMSGCHCSN